MEKILNLILNKVESLEHGQQELKQEVKKINSRMDKEFGDINSRMDKEFGDINSRMDKEFGDINSRMDSEFKNIYNEFKIVNNRLDIIAKQVAKNTDHKERIEKLENAAEVIKTAIASL